MTYFTTIYIFIYEFFISKFFLRRSTNSGILLASFMVVSKERSSGIKVDYSRSAIGFTPDEVDNVINPFRHFVGYVPWQL